MLVSSASGLKKNKNIWNALPKADHIAPQVTLQQFVYSLEYNGYF